VFRQTISLLVFAGGFLGATLAWPGSVIAQESVEIKPSHHVRGLAFSPNGKILAGFGSDVPIESYAYSSKGKGLATLWNVATSEKVKAFEFEFPLHAGAFAPDDRTLAAVGGPNGIRDFSDGKPNHPVGVVWDLKTGKPQAVLARESKETGWSTSVVYTKDGKGLILPHGDGNGTRVLNVDPATGKIRKVLHAIESSKPDWSYPISPDGKKLALDTTDKGGKKLSFIDPVTGAKLSSIETTNHSNVLAFSPASKIVACAALYTYPLAWYEVETGKRLHLVEFAKDHGNLTANLAFSRDGRLLAMPAGTPSFDKKEPQVLLWDVKTGKKVATLKGHTNQILSLAFSPTGDLLATAGAEPEIRLWDLRAVLKKLD
jgi:WD40 repeat protein